MASHPSADNSGPGAERLEAPPPYPPCTRAANELDPIAISQMRTEIPHRGKRLVVRVVAPSICEEALMAVVVDEEDSVARLQLLNQPSETVVPARQTLRLGSFYLIKEPFAIVDPLGGYILRVDHPSDISLLPLDHELVPAEWRKTEIVAGSSRNMRMQGNYFVGKQRWAEAEDL